MNYSQAYEWNSHIIQSRRVDLGPIKIGSKFILVYSILAAIISIVFIRNYARKLQEEKGQQLPVLLISVGLLLTFAAITFVTGMVQLEVALPVLKQLSKTSFIYAEGLSVPP